MGGFGWEGLGVTESSSSEERQITSSLGNFGFEIWILIPCGRWAVWLDWNCRNLFEYYYIIYNI